MEPDKENEGGSGITIVAPYLTASELVSLRTSKDDQVQNICGQKFYGQTKTWLEEKALQLAVENYKDILEKKRASRICDLMKA
ncbi:hypothetical protein X975_04203, partial [Stegodyphus mimosarum]